MKIRRHIILSLVIILSAACLSSYAQRTMRGQYFVDLGVRYPVGAQVSVGQYLIPAYWKAGVELMRMREYLKAGGAVEELSLDIWQAKAQGEFMYRLVSTRSRALSLYGGAGVWIGAEAVDPLYRVPEDIIISLDRKYTFVTGVTPKIEMEVFMGNHVALVLGGQLPLAFMSRIRVVSAQATAGIRVAF